MKQSATTAVLFDLDGTIIDSYKGLQQAFDYAYDQVYQKQSNHNIRPLVGPPMKIIFKQLTGEQDDELIAEFVRVFQNKYDAESYRNCELYEGISDLFKHLYNAGIQLYIATNKRLAPTTLILEHLDIKKYFKGIYSIDSVQPPYPSKIVMVRDILQKEGLQPQHTVFVGDTLHDQHGAEENEVKFIYAGYGFGDLKDLEFTIKHTSEILNYL